MIKTSDSALSIWDFFVKTVEVCELDADHYFCEILQKHAEPRLLINPVRALFEGRAANVMGIAGAGWRFEFIRAYRDKLSALQS